MDLVTHALSGAAIGAACAPSPREQASLMLLGAATALVPDLDALAGLKSRIYAWRYHRVLLHGLPTVPIQAAVVYAIATSVGMNEASAWVTALTIVCSLLAHLLLDAVTSFGTALGFPFTRRYFSTRSHFIIDPVILGALVISLVFNVPILGLATCVAWLAISVAIRHRLCKIVSRMDIDRSASPGTVLIEPGPLAPFRWLVAVHQTTQYSSIATISWRGRLLTPWRHVESRSGQAFEERSRAIPLVQCFLETVDCPHWELVHQGPEGTTLILEDLKWRIAPPFRPLAFVIHLQAGVDRAEQMPLWWKGPGRHADPALNANSTDRIVVVTTAAPPWYTGTALNPLHRAQALARRGWRVVLMFPWLAPKDQAAVFPPGIRFASRQEHADWIKENYPIGPIQLAFYPATWSRRLQSIFPAGRLSDQIPGCHALLLEEPEHLQLLRPWVRLKQSASFGRIVGIIHTNSRFYVESQAPRPLRKVFGAIVQRTLDLVARRNCHTLIKLSAAVPGFAAARIENVNGVDEAYLKTPLQGDESGLYFIGKLIWEKGWHEIIELLAGTGAPTLHAFGDGDPDSLQKIRQAAASHRVPLMIHGRALRPWEALHRFKVFVNCSRSEVLCTTTAEALAMGKFALVPRHPSNAFFETHPNCLVYESPQEFRKLLAFALTTAPRAVDARPMFSWDAATDRLLRASGIEHATLPKLSAPARRSANRPGLVA
ncbi:MAG: hypothetical protein RI884_2592 [Pseudomonadota bacterium]|jgi:digalactosyldiacylglycerol synthase